MVKKTTEFNFEAALAELNQIVEKMEKGGLTLENSLQDFERGIQLTRQCQESLKAAEQKVQILMQKNSESLLENFEYESTE